jgi:exonuclease SbcD
MFKFIHTSDWHLGQNFYGYDRSEEQSDFLQQLADIVRKHTPDALLVSGDIYNTAAPSNATVNMYVNAMLDIHRACPTMAIIVIAGNHDSASRLDSDRQLWELAGVTVVGSITRGDKGKADLAHHLVNVGDKGIVAAVPFAYPASFPLTTDDPMDSAQRQQAYFQALLDLADAHNTNGLPVVLMAHLAVSNSDFTGHDRDMKMECVDLSTLGTGYDYAALGHIHRPQQVSEHARYCGTPVPVSFDEQCEHSVTIVEIDAHGSQPVISTKQIKNIKPLHTIPANEPVDFEVALQQLQAINPNERSYIRLNVKVDRYLPHGAQEKAVQAVKDKQCRFCEIKKTVTATEYHRASQMTVEQLNRMLPLDVANQFFIDKTGEPMTQQEQAMFNEVYHEIEKENRQ